MEAGLRQTMSCVFANSGSISALSHEALPIEANQELVMNHRRCSRPLATLSAFWRSLTAVL